MNNETTGANSVVETPSTATEVEVAIPAAGPERIEWQKTGNLPKAASTTAPETDSKETVKSAPAPEAGKNQEKKSPAAARLDEILADLKAAGFDGPAELKTFKREAAKPTQAEPSPAKQPEVKAAPVQKLEAPKEPDMSDPQYAGEDGWKKYDADVKKFNRELASYEAKKAVEDYKREQAQEVNFNRVQAQIKKGLETYADFDQKTAPVFEALIADLDNPVAKAVGVSPVFEHLMYTIGEDGAAFLALAKSDPLTAVKKVGVMEALIMEKLAANGKGSAEDKPRDEKGQFLPPEKKAKVVSSAPEPPHEVGGKGTPPADEVEAALESGDTRAYIDAQNARDLAARRKR